MNLLNFKIADDNIAIETSEDGYLDLHNNFNLHSFHYNFNDRSFVIHFTKSNGDWVSNYSFNSFRLLFSNVEVLRIKELDTESISSFREDDQTLALIGLTDKDDKNFIGVLNQPNLLDGKYAMTISTENGQAIVVYAETIEFQKEQIVV